MFLEGEICILNIKAKNGLPNRVGERCVILENQYSSLNYDYQIEFDDGETAPVKDVELNKLTEKDKVWMDYIFTGNKVLHNPSGEEVKILKADYLFGQAEVEFDDNSNVVVMMDCLRKLEKESASVEEYTNDDILDIFFGHYKNENNTYTLPKELLLNILKQFLGE
jgi:hypothetical protein